MKLETDTLKRCLSLLLALLLSFSALPTTTVAAELTEGDAIAVDELEPTEDASGGSTSEAPAEEPDASTSEAPAEDASGGSTSEAPAEDASGGSTSEAPAEEPAASTSDAPAEEPSDGGAAEEAAAVQALIDALPDAADITAENADAVSEQLAAIDDAEDALSDEAFALLDTTRYDAAAAALEALDGQEPADEPETIASSHTHDGVTFTAWTSSDSLPSSAGSYYLTEDVKLSSTWTVSADITLCLNGHTITGSGSARVISVSSGKTLNLYDCKGTGKITGGSTTGDGAGVYVNNSSTFNLYGGTISGNTATGDSSYGGGVCVYQGAFNMYGGTISGNTAKSKGGGVSVWGTGSTFTMTGGTISDNSVTKDSGNGGGVYIGSSTTFTLSGGTISNNTSNQYGGGVFTGSSSTFELSGGTISGNTSTSWGGGVYAYGTFTMSSGTISNNKGGGAAGVYMNGGTFTMSGGEITGNTATNTTGGVYICLATFTMTGGKISDNTAGMNGGGVELYSNSSTSSTFELSGGEITGNTASSNGGGVYMNGNSIFTMSGGTISGNASNITSSSGSAGGGGVYVAGSTFTMSDGKITGNTTATTNGAGVLVTYSGADSTFKMTGGTISNNNAGGSGGGVYVVGNSSSYSNTFTMTGGSITGNTASNNGNGVYVGGTFAASGETLSDTVYTTSGGTTYLTIEGVTLAGSGSVYYPLTAGEGVTLGSDNTTTYDFADVALWGKVNGSISVTVDSYDRVDTSVLATPKTGNAVNANVTNGSGSFTMPSSATTVTVTHTHTHANGTAFTVWTDTTSLPTEVGNYVLAADVTISSTWSVPTGETNLCLNGHSITYSNSETTGSVISIGSDATLNLYDCAETQGKITGGTGKTSDNYTYGGGVYVDGGSFNLYSGSISGNSAKYGGGVYVTSSGTFTMSGGTISGNTTTNSGGGVDVDGGTFTMSGGTISGNTATDRGGGVYVSSGSFTMSGGTISGNAANDDADGGGVYVSSGSFTMFDGTISENTAETRGGGVYVRNGSFTMSGGTISGNTAKYCGGVCVYDKGTFTMSGGSITGNKTNKKYSGGVYVNGTFTMSGGTISENTTETNGGGVYVYGNGTFTMSGGTISKNTAEKNGGGVYVNGGTFKMSDGTLSGNVARNNGGGVDVDGGTFTMSGGTLSGNTAKYNGVYMSDSGTALFDVKIDDAVYVYDSTGTVYFGVDGNAVTSILGSTLYYLLTVEGTATPTGDITTYDGRTWGKYGGTISNVLSAKKTSSGEAITVENKSFTMPDCLVSVTAAPHEHNDTTFTGWIETDSLPTEAGTYYLATDVTLSSTWSVPSGETTLCLNGHTITYSNSETTGSVISIGSGATLNLYDCQNDAGKITGGNAQYGGGVYVEGGTFNMAGGTISGNSATYNGGGVYVIRGTFNLTNGTISNNAATGNSGTGGGVYVASDGTFTMSDGTISGNTASLSYGGVIVNRGTALFDAKCDDAVYVVGVGSTVYFGVDGIDVTNDTTSPVTLYYLLTLGDGITVSGDVITAYDRTWGKVDGSITASTCAKATKTADSSTAIDMTDSRTFTMPSCCVSVAAAHTVSYDTAKTVWTWKQQTTTSYTAYVEWHCANCDEVVEKAEATVTSVTGDDGSVTYTATATNAAGTTFTNEKVIAATTYDVTVTGGTIAKVNDKEVTSTTSGSYTYDTKLTLVANDPEDGQYFTGWYLDDKLLSTDTKVEVRVKSAMKLEAKFGETKVEAAPTLLLTVSARATVSGTQKEKVSMTVRWDLPEGCSAVAVGIVRSYTVSDATKLVLGNVDGSTIRKNSASTSATTGTYTYNLTMSATTKLKPLYVVGYLTYKDADGNETTIYTSMVISPAATS